MQLPFREYHLLQILEGIDFKVPLDLYLNLYFRSHKAIGSKDRKYIGDTVYGLLRWKSLLDFLITTKKTWEKRLSLFLRINPKEYVQDSSIPLHDRVSFPESLFSLLAAQYGEEKAIELCLISNTQAKTTIRINPLKTTRLALFEKWKKEFEIELTQRSDLGITFKKKVPLFHLPEFQGGLFEIQDEGSQLLADLVRPNPGELVLDYCAGSGGKTLGFAHYLQGKGQIYLHDIRPTALSEAKKRLKRAGIQNAQIILPDAPTLKALKKKMDWVLVDAPCSGTGTLRRNPDMKWRFNPEFLKELLGEQRTIFERALSFVKPGGKIVYATCSILREENEAQMEHFLKTYDLTLVNDPLIILPEYGKMDGFFGVVFEKLRQN